MSANEGNAAVSNNLGAAIAKKMDIDVPVDEKPAVMENGRPMSQNQGKSQDRSKKPAKREFFSCPVDGSRRNTDRDGSPHVVCGMCHTKVRSENSASASARAFARSSGESVSEMSPTEWALRHIDIAKFEAELASAQEKYPDAQTKFSELKDAKSDEVRENISVATGESFVSDEEEYTGILLLAVRKTLGEPNLSLEAYTAEMDKLKKTTANPSEADRKSWGRVTTFAGKESGLYEIRRLEGRLKAAKELVEANPEIIAKLNPVVKTPTEETDEDPKGTVPELKVIARELGVSPMPRKRDDIISAIVAKRKKDSA